MSGYSLITKKASIKTTLKPLNPHPNPVPNYPMFIHYTHINKKDNTILARHNKLVTVDHEITNYYSEPYPYEVNDIFYVHLTIPHYEINGADISDSLNFDMDLKRLQVNTLYKIPFEEKIHSFILREDGNLEYFIHS